MSSSTPSASATGLIDTAHNSSFKIVGICLAIGSGVFIGTSFVVKKKGLLSATSKEGNAAGEGHAYLKSWIWWTGMSLMIIGEILNFVAYAFTEAILVTPMGALSVVICAILSHFFLKESLTFFGWIGCTLCIIGATILALNAPEQQSSTTILSFRKLFLAPGFLVWGSLCIALSLGVAVFVAPKWGKKNMMPYITICSLIGGISVSCTQGLGASIVTSIQGNDQVKNWFFWFLFVFVVVTLLVEINYLNKALELFNTSMVILYQGLKASAVSLITMVMGFLVICLGITLLQMSKVDPKQLVKLDRKSTMLFEAAKHDTENSEKGEVSAMEDPGMDALRGGFGAVGSIIRARSVSRRLSNASTWSGKGRGSYSQNNLSTHGLGNFQRFQLSDNPMPNDALDQISLHTPKSPVTRDFASADYFPPERSKSHLKFEEADVVHQYGYGREDDAQHFTRARSASHHTMGRNPSAGAIYPPVEEETEDDDLSTATHLADETSPIEKRAEYYPDPYRQLNPPAARPELHSTPSTSSNSPRPTLSNLFNFSTSTDPSRARERDDRDQVRGGQHRGMKDYPHLSKNYAAEEKGERAALVGSDGEEEELPRENLYASGGVASPAGKRLPSIPGGPRGPRGAGEK